MGSGASRDMKKAAAATEAAAVGDQNHCPTPRLRKAFRGLMSADKLSEVDGFLHTVSELPGAGPERRRSSSSNVSIGSMPSPASSLSGSCGDAGDRGVFESLRARSGRRVGIQGQGHIPRRRSSASSRTGPRGRRMSGSLQGMLDNDPLSPPPAPKPKARSCSTLPLSFNGAADALTPLTIDIGDSAVLSCQPLLLEPNPPHVRSGMSRLNAAVHAIMFMNTDKDSSAQGLLFPSLPSSASASPIPRRMVSPRLDSLSTLS